MSAQGAFDLRCDLDWCEELWESLAWGDSERLLAPDDMERAREVARRSRFLEVAERFDFLGRSARPGEA